MKTHIDYTAGIRKRRTWFTDTDASTEKPPSGEQPDKPAGDTSTASTETVNTDTEISPYVSKDRFNVVNEKMKQGELDLTAARTELETFKTAQEKAEEDRLKKQGEFEKLYTDEQVKTVDLTAQLDTASTNLKAYQDVFSTMLEKRMEKVPDHIKPLLEKMDALEVMTYLDANEEQFTAPDGTPRKQTAPPMHGSDGVGNKPGEQKGTLRVRGRL